MDKKEIKEIKELLELKEMAKSDPFDGIFKDLFQSLFLAIIFGLFVMLLWNALLPDLFNFPKILYLQSVGLIILTRLIFGCISFKHDHMQSYKAHNRKENPMGLSLLDNISDWKYYDKYWYEEGEQSFKDYINRMKEDTGRDADNSGNE